MSVSGDSASRMAWSPFVCAERMGSLREAEDYLFNCMPDVMYLRPEVLATFRQRWYQRYCSELEELVYDDGDGSTSSGDSSDNSSVTSFTSSTSSTITSSSEGGLCVDCCHGGRQCGGSSVKRKDEKQVVKHLEKLPPLERAAQSATANAAASATDNAAASATDNAANAAAAAAANAANIPTRAQ